MTEKDQHSVDHTFVTQQYYTVTLRCYSLPSTHVCDGICSGILLHHFCSNVDTLKLVMALFLPYLVIWQLITTLPMKMIAHAHISYKINEPLMCRLYI